MKEKQTSKLKMYMEISGLMEKNLNKWSNVIEIKNTYEDFLNNNDKIIELKADHDKDISPVISSKAAKREELINKAVPIANVLQVYAYDANDKDLSKSVNFSRNKLTKSKDSELIDKCNIIWKTAKKLYGKSLSSAEEVINSNKKARQASPNISGYGLSGQMIDELEEANKAFIDAILELKDAISHKNKCAKKVNEHIKTNDKLLRNKLDRLMTLFETSEPGFYQDYKKARVVKAEQQETTNDISEATQEGEKQEPAQKTENVQTGAGKSPSKTTRKTVSDQAK
jgi:hypothetical protein